jgi:hypothetical protein
MLSSNTLEGRKLIPSPEYRLPVWINDYKKWVQYYGPTRLYFHLRRAILEYDMVMHNIIFDTIEALRLSGFNSCEAFPKNIEEQKSEKQNSESIQFIHLPDMQIKIEGIGLLSICGEYKLVLNDNTVIQSDDWFTIITHMHNIRKMSHTSSNNSSNNATTATSVINNKIISRL